MAYNERVQGGSDEGGYTEPPVSRAEQLIQAHPDITAIRDMTGIIIDIYKTFPSMMRNIDVDVKHEKGSQRHYPTVIIDGFDGLPRHDYDYDKDIGLYGLNTLVKIHVEDDEQLTVEVGYKEQLRCNVELPGMQRREEKTSHPIPAQELVATARTGLEMLKAYQEASPEQRDRIDNMQTGFHGWSQIVDETRPDVDAYIAEVSPLLSDYMKQQGISFTYAGAQAIHALNALNRVTDAMLPSEMPPAPQNRKEPARRTRPPGR